MEFALFLQGYNPGFRREGNPDAEHQVFLDELRCAEAADKAGFKYVWLTEHHFLDEYSHLSANDAFAGYLASSTDRIHIFGNSPMTSSQISRVPVRSSIPGRKPRIS